MKHWSDIYDTYDEYLQSRQKESQRDLNSAAGVLFGLAISLSLWVLLSWWVI
jgi:hypothetical protein